MPPVNFTLASYTNEPAARLQEIHRLCLQPYGLENTFPVTDLDNVPTHYTANHGIFLLVKQGEDIIGYGAIENLYEGIVGTLTRLRILPSYQRQGIGAALVQELLTRARNANYQRLYLDTSTLQDASALYEKFGFTEFHRQTGKSGITDIYYELKLT